MAQQKIQLGKLRDFGENFSDTFQFIKQEFKPLITCFLVISGFFILSSSILGGLYQKDAFGFLDQFQPGLNSIPQRGLSETFTIGYFAFLIVTVLNISVMRTVVAVYMKLYDETGESPSIQEVWNMFARYFFRIFLYSIPQFILIMVGMIFCLAPGIYFMVVLLPYPFMVVNENVSFTESFNRSIYLIKENFWVSLGTYFVAYIIYAVSSSVIGLMIGAIFGVGSYLSTGELSSAAAYVTAVLSLVQYVFYIVFFVSVGLHYYHLVEQKDGTGLTKRLETLGDNSGTNTSIEEQY
ncbi:hypothetical protein [Limnovirga soli]|uniref:Glycerophosphoryl diester phosphodiesterase membrane domain-containing protein n=1 Tax=Limnovirga soli TaxID=2656915 RepID=A0A8J8FBY8_9BACT|nr:hypothetical protein [Limnovirga soli]NNV55198.1 hypothetical protein [Limnovirga soli]